MYVPPKIKSAPNRPKRDNLVTVFFENQEGLKTRSFMWALDGQLLVVACVPPGMAFSSAFVVQKDWMRGTTSTIHILDGTEEFSLVFLRSRITVFT